MLDTNKDVGLEQELTRLLTLIGDRQYGCKVFQKEIDRACRRIDRIQKERLELKKQANLSDENDPVKNEGDPSAAN
ncbi:MAG: hypothetical protein NVS3B3_06680 [Aquirhabdus sp.]